MKYRTKLVLANAARQEFDVEALTANEAALKAAGHWDDLWKSRRSRTTDAAIHVYEINTGTGDAYSTCALVMLPKSTDVDREVPKEDPQDKVPTKKGSKRKHRKAARTRRT